MKVTAFVVAVIFLILGSLTVAYWDGMYTNILHDELSLSNTSKGYNMWKETPIPMYLKIYLYNWTNAEEATKDWKLKPEFEQCGPYVFLEHHKRVNMTWNPNDTITFMQERRWYFQEDLSNGTLDDKITNLNVIATTAAYTARNFPALIKEGLNFLLGQTEKVVITRTSGQWMFDGFDDKLIDLLKNFSIPIHMPFDKFGWFYLRNNSATYDGSFTMYTGRDDIELLGIIEEWNGKPKSPAYPSYCGFVNGTSGELWPPVKKYNKVSVFSPDICSSITLFQSDDIPSVAGIEGKSYVGTDYIFDNGTKYPEQACFNGVQVFPSGIRDVSKCKFGAPAFVSYPHFKHADPWYLSKINGLDPNGSDYSFKMSLEPNTGVPLEVDAQFQINILVDKITHIDMFKKAPKMMIPMLWFKQTATLTDEYASQIKFLLLLPQIGNYTAYGMIGIGCFIAIIAIIVTIKNAWKGSNGEESQLLPEDKL